MTVEIQDAKAVAEIERLSAGLAVPAEEVVRRAVLEKAERERGELRRTTDQEKRVAIREFQRWYATYRDPNDGRDADEIVGYDEHRLFG